MAKKSPATCKVLLDALKAAYDGGFVRLYDGTPPADAHAALAGNTLLVEYTVDGDGATGLTFDAPVIAADSAVLSKAAAEDWKGTAVASGTATFARLYDTAGRANTAASTTLPRIQGSVGVGGAVDWIIADTDIVSGNDYDLPVFNLYATPT